MEGGDITALRIKKRLDESTVTLEEYAKLLGVSKKTLYNKLVGATEFTISEYRALKKIFPEYDVLYLLTNEADDT